MSKEFEEKKKEEFLDFLESGDPNATFDLYGQDPNDWAWLAAFIPGIKVTSAGGLIPFQAEGTLHGHPFYYRERHGVANLRIGEFGKDEAYIGNQVLWSASEEVEEFRSGPGWIETLMRLVETLERSPFLYKFPGKKVDITGEKNDISGIVATDFEEFYVGWGFSAEEAFAYASRPSPYLLSVGWDEEFVNQITAKSDMSSVPLEEDNRNYPETEPEFKVTVPELWRDQEGKVSIPEEVFKSPVEE